jgi:hypothetical protein
VLSGLFADAIQAASPDVTLIECLRAALAAAEVAMKPDADAAGGARHGMTSGV